jgi:hypothetical protein
MLWSKEMLRNMTYFTEKFLQSLVVNKYATSINSELTKETLASLCELASTEKDKCLIKYVACTANSQLSKEQARKKYGVSNLTELTSKVHDALAKAEEIQETVYKLARLEEKCFLENLGIVESDTSEDSDSSDNKGEDNFSRISSSDDEMDIEWTDNENTVHRNQMEYTAENHSDKNTEACAVKRIPVRADKGPQVHPDELMKNRPVVSPVPSVEHLLFLLRSVQLNWFSFVEELKLLLNAYSSEVLNQALIDSAHQLPFTYVSHGEEVLIEQSRQAFLMIEREKEPDDDIVSESESDDPELYAEVRSIEDFRDPKVKELFTHKRRLLKKKAKRKCFKEITERALMNRHVPKRASKLLKQYPNLGRDIEAFVTDNRIGAGAWRRTV